jgi:hypothetical protein
MIDKCWSYDLIVIFDFDSDWFMMVINGDTWLLIMIKSLFLINYLIVINSG